MASDHSNEASIFNSARKIESAEDRNAFLDKACGDDAPLRERIEKLLANYSAESQFLEQPAAEGLEETMPPGTAGGDLAASLQAGLAPAFGEDAAVVIGGANHSVLRSLRNKLDDVPRVSLRESKTEVDDPLTRPTSPEMPDKDSDGRYQLQGEIARGGMGAILKGRDTDLGRDLAIKVLLDAHKDKPEVIQRFVEEAQIGGQLQHPGIAPVYELGQFADQRPFFSMKLVKGQTLSNLLADREDPAADRGKLVGIFEHVCQTMAYAHSRGVMHRDLKPANIMVGAFGEVQVMDWGLAKVLQAGGIEDEKRAHKRHKDISIIQTMRSVGSDAPGTFKSHGSDTQIGSVMGTPAYMPPEQALGEIDQMDERADVFGLGAILCEILTGKPPYVADEGTQVYRMASKGKLDDCLERLDQCGADVELIELTKHCLEVEPADRPRDAQALSERVTGYLESVEFKLRTAEQERAAEVARNIEQRKRQRVTLALAACILLVLSCGIAATSWQAREAQRARVAEAKRADGERLARLAEAEATAKAKQRAKQLEAGNKVIGSIFEDLDIKHEVTESGQPLQAVLAERLVNAAKQLDGEAVGDKLVVAQLQARLGESLTNLGYAREAAAVLEKSRATNERLLGAKATETLESMCKLSNAYSLDDQSQKALALAEQAFVAYEALLGPKDPETLAAMNLVGTCYLEVNRTDEALPVLRKCLELRKAVLKSDDPILESSVNNLANAYHKLKLPEKALPLMEEAFQMCKKRYGTDHPATATFMANLGVFHADAGRYEAALSLLKKSLELRTARLGRNHPASLHCMHNVGLAYQLDGQLDNSIAILEETMTLRKGRLGTDHEDTLETMNELAVSYGSSKQYEKAIPIFEEALEHRKPKGIDHPDTLSVMRNLGIAYSRVGRHTEAIQLLEEAIGLAEPALGSNDSVAIDVKGGLAAAYHANGQMDKALPLFEETLRLRRANLGDDDLKTLVAMYALGTTYNDVGRYEKAIPLLEHALKRRRTLLGPTDSKTVDTVIKLGQSYSQSGRFKDVIRELERALNELSPDHLNRDNLCLLLLPAYHNTEQWRKSVPVAKELLDSVTARFGPNGPLALIYMNTLGRLHGKANEYEKSITVLEDSLQRHIAVHGEKDATTVETMNLLIKSYFLGGQHDKAASIGEKLFQISKTKSGPDHPDTASAATELGVMYSAAGKDEKAIAAWTEAVRINPNLVKVQYWLGEALTDSKRYREAIKPLRIACDKIPDGPQGASARELLLTVLAEQDINDDEVHELKSALAKLQVLNKYSPSVAAVLVPSNATWKWLHPVDNTDPAESDPDFHTTFFNVDYDDESWTTNQDSAGPTGGFGYGDESGVDIGTPKTEMNDEGEVFRYGAYFRCSFTTKEEPTNLELRCQRDDGIIVYLDGKQVARDNMTDGEEAYHLPAATSVANHSETAVFRIPLKDISLAPGEHTLAISLHNTTGASSDLRIAEISLVEVEASRIPAP